MSRHLLPSLPQYEGYEVAVGWDPMSKTFFAFVLDSAAMGTAENAWLVNIGSTPGAVTTPEEAVAAVRSYATIPPGLVDELKREREREATGMASLRAALEIRPDDGDAGGITGDMAG